MTRRVSVPPGFFDGVEPGQTVSLDRGEAHYVLTVLRLTPGATLELFDGKGHRSTVSLVSTDPPTVEILTLSEQIAGESPLEIILFQAIPKGKRWDWLIEKVTELGVHSIVPLQTERTVVRIDERRAADKVRRWQAIISGAARQCGRSRTPELVAPRSISRALEEVRCDRHLAALLTGDTTSLNDALSDSAPTRLGLWVGPEGDFTNEETEYLLRAGARPVTLGPRILRVDTAAIALVTLAQAAAGDLQST
jgi:16S rRNA (uracil1498-N3)-methyltransferase